jgi:signal transduction histidine kinase
MISESNFENTNLLIVDDDVFAREIIESHLIKEKYHLDFVNSAAEAFTSLNTKLPDVILLDVMMDEMDGFNACKIIKDNNQWRHIPVLLITSLNDKDSILQGLDSGADDFLSKPVNGPELRARVRSMLRIKKYYDELLNSLEMREEMAKMIVHDIKNPLFVIQYFASALKKSIQKPENIDRLDQINFQIQRINSLLTDMLLTAKMESGKTILQRSPVDINHLIKTVGENYQIMTQIGQKNLIMDLPNKSHTLSLDEKLFIRVIDNLIHNAFKFSRTKSTITIKAQYLDNPERTRIQIIDEGLGIPKDKQEKIFEKYEVVKMKKSTIPQIGLGLPFCKLVVEAHGGQIYVEDNKPQGAIFNIEI